jgi:hypothetical protein
MRCALLSCLVLLTSTVAAAQTSSPTTPAAATESLRAWPTLPPERNAAIPFREVADAWIEPALRMEAPEVDREVHRPNAVITEAQVPDAQRWVDYWHEELAKLDEAIDPARGAEQFDWGDPPPSPVVLQRSDARIQMGGSFAVGLLKLDAILALREGSAPRAWRRAGQLWALADAAHRWPDSGARIYARVNADRPACATFESLARAEAFPVFAQENRDEVIAVIRALVDDAECRARFAHALRVERAIMDDAVACFADGKLPPADRKQINEDSSRTGIILSRGTREQLEHLPVILDAYASLIRPGEPFTAAQQRLVWRERLENPLMRDLRVRVLGTQVSPWFASELASLFEVLARRRLAGTALAVALYRADHDGRWPESLEALVPEYLREVPQDLLARNAAPIRYRAAPEPIVWSTGQNGTDDGGKEVTDQTPPAERARGDLVVRFGP